MAKLNKSTAVAIMLSIDTAQLIVLEYEQSDLHAAHYWWPEICELWLELVGHVVLPSGLFN